MRERITDWVMANTALTALVVLIVALLAVNIYLYTQWQSVNEARAQLETQERIAAINLATTVADYDVEKLRADEAKLKATPDIPVMWPSELPVIDLGVLLTEASAENYVTIDAVSSKTGTIKIDGKQYPDYETELTVTGALRNIIQFIDDIEHGVDLYIAGHDHALEMLKPVRGVHYVITGAGGGPGKAYPVEWTNESFYVATLGGFTLIRMSRDEIRIEFVRMDARTQYAHTISKSN